MILGCSSAASEVESKDAVTSEVESIDTGSSEVESIDSATIEAPDGAPMETSPPKDSALFDDFESGTSKWTIVSPDCSGTGSIAIDGSLAHGGKQSLKVTGAGGYCNHVFAKTDLALGPQIYARFYLRMETALGDGHTTFLSMKDSADSGKALRMGGQNKVLMFNRESDDATLPTMSPVGVGKSKSISPGSWTCIELHVDQSAGTIETWIDGAKIEGLQETGTAVADVSTQWLSRAWKPSLVDLKLGWESYAGQDMTLHFDDVALSTTRIGCSP